MYINAYVDVLTLITADGKKIPQKIFWSDGRGFEIEEYKECGLVKSYGGRIGYLYKIKISGKEKKLYLDQNSCKWFVDIK